jgi:hypothetical protein
MFTHKSTRAFGRSLADFEKPPGLHPAESALLHQVQSGQIHYVNSDPVLKQLDLIRAHSKFKDKSAEKTSPTAEDGLWNQGKCPNTNDVKEHLIRADFIRFLLLGGDERAPVHERGVWIDGAYIDGDIFLDGCNADFPLRLDDCWIVGSLTATNAKTRMLSLEGCRIGGIEADCANVDGAVVLRNGFVSQGVVRLFGAKINGPLDCQDGLLLPDAAGDALICSSAEISGYVRLNGAFEAHGEVRFDGAHVTGDFNCWSGRFKRLAEPGKREGSALSCLSAFVGGEFILNQTNFEGLVNLNGTQINRGFLCSHSIFKNSQGNALSCDAASVNAGVDMTSTSFHGGVRFYRTHIGLDFNCAGTKLTAENGSALLCGSASVTGSVYLNAGFAASGAVNFSGAEVGGDFDCSAGRFSLEHGWALDCSSAIIKGTVRLTYNRSLRRRFIAIGGVNLLGAKIDGNLACDGAAILIPEGRALDLGAAEIGGDFTVWEGWTNKTTRRRFRAKGSISLFGAKVGGLLNLGGAKLQGNGEALIATNAQMGKDALVCQAYFGDGDFGARFEASGLVTFQDAAIGQSLNCAGAVLDNRQKTALNCAGATIEGHVFLGQPKDDTAFGQIFCAIGCVFFYGAHVRGNLECIGANFQNPGGVALDGTAVEITGSVFLSRSGQNKSFRSDGRICFAAASIGLQFICFGAEFKNAAASKLFKGSADYALDLSNSTIKDTLFFGPDIIDEIPAKIDGSLSLQDTTVRELVDFDFLGENTTTHALTVKDSDGNSRDCVMALDGFMYERLGGSSVLTASARQAWLERQPRDHLASDFRHQPFEQLVKVLRSMGHDADARRIAICKQRYLTRLLGNRWQLGLQLWQLAIIEVAALTIFAVLGYWWAAVAIAGILVWTGTGRWFGRKFLDHFVKYGYQPERAIIYILVVGMLAGWFFQQAAQSGAFVPKDIRELSNNSACGPNWAACELHRFHPYVYSFDNMLPIVHLGVAEAWSLKAREVRLSDPFGLFAVTVPDWVAQWVIWAETTFGWLAGGIIIAVAAGLLKRE